MDRMECASHHLDEMGLRLGCTAEAMERLLASPLHSIATGGQKMNEKNYQMGTCGGDSAYDHE